MLDAWIIDRLRREEERPQDSGRIPLYRETPQNQPARQDPAYPAQDDRRGSEDIDYRL